jgi:putative phosphoesterase
VSEPEVSMPRRLGDVAGRTCDPAAHPLMLVAVLADTHRRAARARDLPAAVFALAADADVILHAGDVVDQAVLDVLAEHAPVHAVLGNNDTSLAGVLPERLEVELAGVRVGMVHDSGQATGRERRLHRMFPAADVVVFGHSHIPWSAEGVGGQLLFNPGSPTQRRRQPVATMGRLTLQDARVVEATILPVAE